MLALLIRPKSVFKAEISACVKIIRNGQLPAQLWLYAWTASNRLKLN